MSEVNATLLSHVDSNAVTREQLREVQLPLEPTETFKPIPHIELVETIGNQLADRGFSILDEKLALRRDGAVLFGVMKLQHPEFETPDGTSALGFRQGLNKLMAVQMVAGLSVFVCDNLVFRGDLIALRRKHTSGLVIAESISLGIAEFERHYRRLTGEVEGLKTRLLDDPTAKSLIHDAFVKGLMPLRFLPAVSQEYFQPTANSGVTGRTAWDLHNAFTYVAKQQPLTSRMESTQALGEFFGMVGAVEQAA